MVCEICNERLFSNAIYQNKSTRYFSEGTFIKYVLHISFRATNILLGVDVCNLFFVQNKIP